MAYIGRENDGFGVRSRFIYTATSGQTTFTTDDSSNALSYSDGAYVDVYLNGVLLDPSDYTATSLTSIVLDSGAAASDILEVIVYDVFSVFSGTFTNGITASEATITNGISAGSATVTGDLTVDTSTLKVDSTNNRVLIGNTSSIGTTIVGKVQTSGTESFITTNNEVGGFIGVNSNSDNSLAIGADPDSDRAGSHIAFYVDGLSEKMRIDSSGNVGIGVTDPASYYSENLVVKAPAEGGITIRSNATTDTNYLMFADGTSGTQAYRGYLGYTHNSPEFFNIVSHGYMRFYTGDPAEERLRILSGGGLTFNGDTAAANALDDYEEGSWTPQVIRIDGSVAASIGVGAGSATYVKIGRLVTIKAWINSIANGSANGSSYWTVTGLPFAATPYSTAAKGYGSITPDGYYAGDANGQIILTSTSAPYTGSLSGHLMITLTYETNS